MKTNLLFNVAAIAMYLMLIGCLSFRRMTRGRANRLLLIILCTDCICALSDLLGELMGTAILITPSNVFFAHLANYIYYLTVAAIPILFSIYIVLYCGFWHSLAKKPMVKHFFGVPYLVFAILLALNPIFDTIYYFDADYVLHHGSVHFVLYVVTYSYAAVILGILFFARKYVRKDKLILLLALALFGYAAAIVRGLFSDLYIDNFAMSIIMLALTIGLNRPEETMDTTAGAENFNSFIRAARMDFMTKSPARIIFIKIVNHEAIHKQLGYEIYRTFIRTLTDEIRKICKQEHLLIDEYFLERGIYAVVTDKSRNNKYIVAAQRINSFLNKPMEINCIEVHAKALVCTVRCPEDIKSEEDLFFFVDGFHKMLPCNGKTQSLEENKDTEEYLVRKNLNSIIDDAIKNKKFKMYYQPIFSLKENRFVSCEALIRLFDDKYGFISPSLFIPYAEDTGAIHAIGDYVLEEVCRFMAQLDFRELGLQFFEINLSVAQCIELNLVEKVMRTLGKYSIDPVRLNLEITETVADYDEKIVDDNIMRLSAAGVTFSLDDYGTGYSDIKRVANLPLSVVKLDKSFVDEMNNTSMMAVICDTVDMLQSINKYILVEGVEDAETVGRFKSLGCEYLQGFYFAKPMPEEEFVEFMRKENKWSNR